MASAQPLTSQDKARVRLLGALEELGYDFVPVTPESQRRVLARPGKQVAADLRDVLGWSLPFEEKLLDPTILQLMEAGALLKPHPLGLASLARVSRVHGRLFLHSAYPTEDEDSVFLGPDTCRFVDFISPLVSETGRCERMVDIGAGAGVGGISVADQIPGARIELADVNRNALGFARVNAASAGVEVALIESDGLDSITAGFDLAIANPPFIFEEDAPAYRRGGGLHGAELSLEWTIAAARKVAVGGRVLLYTGSSIVNGVDPLRARLDEGLKPLGCRLIWREIDPDIFGEELAKPAYQDVERIAAIGAVIEKVEALEGRVGSP